jgi:hypothetical protein
MRTHYVKKLVERGDVDGLADEMDKFQKSTAGQTQ